MKGQTTEADVVAPQSDTRRRVLFIQQFVPKYDAVLYNKLGLEHGFDVWVAADIETAAALNQHHPSSRGYRAVHQKVLFRHGIIRTPGILALTRRVRPDVIIALGNPRYLALPLLLLVWRLQGIPAMVWGMFHRNGPTHLVSRALFAAMSLAARRLLVYGDRGAKELISSGIPADLVRVVSTGIDLTACAEAVRNSDPNELADFLAAHHLRDKTVFLQVARLTAPKHTELLVECMTEVSTRFPEAVLVLVGEGPERERISALVAKLGLQAHVRLPGPTFHEQELSLWFRAARAVVCGGAVGLLAHHALAYAAPVIAHSAFLFHGPEAEIIVHKSTGFLYEQGSKKSLADAMIYAASHEAEMCEMGLFGQKRVGERFTIDAKARRFRDAILEVTNNPGTEVTN